MRACGGALRFGEEMQEGVSSQKVVSDRSLINESFVWLFLKYSQIALR